MPLLSFCFVGALYVAWVPFYVGLFSVRTFFQYDELHMGFLRSKGGYFWLNIALKGPRLST
jgi:hypothetical protein